MLHIRPEARGGKGSELSGVRADWTNTHEISGGPGWRTSCRDGRGTTPIQSVGTPNPLRNWKVLLWVVVSLLPLVEGARVGAGFGANLGQALGMMGRMGERQFPDTLPEVDEEQEEERDPNTPWYGLYDRSAMYEVDDNQRSLWGRRSPRNSDPSDADPKGSAKKKKKRKKKEKDKERDRKSKGNGRKTQQSSRDCRVEKREMRVRDLGLGFDSDEIVLFKFCVGSCQSSRTNYDLALRALMLNGSLPRRTLRRVGAHPCCRPDRYEPVSFMDAHTTWQTIRSLSAASCACVG
ncbi:glial cell line-derived neurotrophic factor [Esox lucius]|uniref:TGF-beta family profile domain-containing protein n=1 Tax=Esox lucius TaxID=8010 RepID=A0A3P8YWE4_ESOLU|nr:glial cell line-derived neurotrophic factor [Esox lucius]